MNESTCKSCGAKIRWVRTVNGKMMPINIEPCDDGNVTLSETGIAYVGWDSGQPLFVSAKKYKSHFATCPFAELHRRAKED